MSSFEIIIDRSIEGAIRRIIKDKLGDISVQITRQDKLKYVVKIESGIIITTAQKLSLRNAILDVFDAKGLIVSFKAWSEDG